MDSGEFFYPIFLGSTILLWLLTVGYAILLTLSRRAGTEGQLNHFPEITVIIAVVDEACWIRDKIENIRQAGYPLDRIEIVIVDGGSDDGTAELAEASSVPGCRVRVLHCPKGAGKAEQINAGVRAARTELVVCTDADTMLAGGCLTHLVATLLHNQRVDIVGARIVPVTGLLEEKLHWRIVNLIWWLEGRAFHAAGISGACYAARSRVFRAKLNADAEDVELAQRSAMQGCGAVITAWPAVAFEKRVPATIAEWLEYRMRRGRKYRGVVMNPPAGKDFRRRCFVHNVRISQFVLVPLMTFCCLVSGLVLLVTGQQWPAVTLFAAAAFAVPALPLLAPLCNEFGVIRTVIGTIRWSILMVYVLMVIQCSGESDHVPKLAQPDDAA